MLRRLQPTTDQRLMVSASTGDDAAVWRLDDDRALVVTADFITPLVDDARTWGRIAAANAVSDVYAMGGTPLLALNLVAWNKDELPLDMLADVLAGSADVADDGGFVIAGGHTVDDPIPKFGLAVVGEVHPDRLLTNAGFLADQDLVLTKPLGIGVLSTAIKRGQSEAAAAGLPALDSLVEAAIASMTRLNRRAAAVALAAGATGATDVTGFGLLGHLGRALTESKIDAIIEVAAVPILPGIKPLVDAGFVPGGSRRNLDAVRPRLVSDDAGPIDLDGPEVLLLADAQTSGGLVFGCPPQRTPAVLNELRTDGHTAAVVGRTASPGQLTGFGADQSGGWMHLV